MVAFNQVDLLRGQAALIPGVMDREDAPRQRRIMTDRDRMGAQLRRNLGLDRADARRTPAPRTASRTAVAPAPAARPTAPRRRSYCQRSQAHHARRSPQTPPHASRSRSSAPTGNPLPAPARRGGCAKWAVPALQQWVGDRISQGRTPHRYGPGNVPDLPGRRRWSRRHQWRRARAPSGYGRCGDGCDGHHGCTSRR